MCIIKKSTLLLTIGFNLFACISHNIGNEDKFSHMNTPWPYIKLTRNEAIETRIDTTLKKMSLEQKVGQLIQPDIKSITPEEISRYHIGSILNGGGTMPYNKHDAELSDWIKLAEELYQASALPKGDLPIIPIMWGTDAVHGHNNLRGAVLFPHNIGLGAANDEELIYKIGRATAEDLLVSGINWTFSPTLAVVRDDRWGRTYEGYSEHPDIVSRFASRLVKAIQSTGEGGNIGVIATAKHFVGDGGTTYGIDRGDTVLSEQALYELHGQGFVSAIQADVLAIMASFSSWNSDKLHDHTYLLSDILKGRMGFDGIVIGDWNAHQHVRGCTVESCSKVINAGVDIVMVPQDWKALYENTLTQLRSGEISNERLDDAVSRILRVKIKSGLMDAPAPSKRTFYGDEKTLFSNERKALAREAVRKSLVLLKNNKNTLPLAGNAKVLVTGPSADDVSMQSGGWTLSWQGTGNERGDFPQATTVYEGIRDALESQGGEAIYSESGDYDGQVDAVIVVTGEEPYAEWHGDIPSLEFERGEKTSLALLKKVGARNVPVITLFLSGRPMWVNAEINMSDAFVAAWLPGTEGAGIADVIIGKQNKTPRYDFTGKLSYSWPKFPTQVVNKGDNGYAPLFAYGYGLHYGDTSHVLATLSVEGGHNITRDGREPEWIFVSRVIRPWRLHVISQNRSVTLEANYYKSDDDDPITVLSVDKDSQEDARRIHWPQNSTSHIHFTATQAQQLAHLEADKGVLHLDIKVDKASHESLKISALCNEHCASSIALRDITTDLELDRWNTLSLPMTCFKNTSGKAVTTAFSLSANGGMTEIANIRILPIDNVENCIAKVR